MATKEITAQISTKQSSTPSTPSGIAGIYNECKRIYPEQTNPLQVSALIKFWLGGPDPLDYVSMYVNDGNEADGIPPHWHYVSFGLSDLHGDGRLHERSNGDGLSGYGFELTFRLRREPDQTTPPTWPATLMQTLSRYVFQTQNTLCVGDHIPWNVPLDRSESRIQHMLMAPDAQLKPITTDFGSLSFVQIVGICFEELKAAQQWNGNGVLELLKSVNLPGGPWLITDMRRGESLFELDPSTQEKVDLGIEKDGSNLGGVSSKCFWDERDCCIYEDFVRDCKTQLPCESGRKDFSSEIDKNVISERDSLQIKETLKRGLINTKPTLPPIKSRSRNPSNEKDAPQELLQTRFLESVHISLNAESAYLLPLVLRGRIKHGRHFTFKSIMNDSAITFVSRDVEGAEVTDRKPYACKGQWLQVLISEELSQAMLSDLEESDQVNSLPLTYKWPEHHFSLTTVPDDI
ncbi:DgyrCDS7458 [Dimorphilus gyrociliatus]|uniref:Suppressor of fused homolog n=1 Tax=Dimorphilus gyrociliatus TaxID=2664684 RepID=A0A7I8VR34_9ANNE|nr:DgyrCDS7458 [Dimorphilus gyrociliatus]